MTVYTTDRASPRLYSRHLRHAAFARMRHSEQRQAFLNQQATRLSTTEAALFADLKKDSALRIKDAASTAGL